MVINIMNNLTLILLVLALCALFPTNTEATNSLSEKFSKCEKDFWFKNLSHFKQSLKSKCLKEKHHHKKEKRHRQHHLCNNNKSHHDKGVILSKWNKFSNCRCESALEELKDIKESKVLTCYQIAKFNKVTGKFIGQLSVFKKKSDHHKYDVAVKYSDIKLLNDKDNWSKTKEGYYRSKQSTEICNDQYSIETYFIRGKISKKESMNKVSLNRVSPLNIKLIDKDSKKSITLSKDQQVTIPFPNFVLNDENKPEPNPKDSKNPQDPKKSADKPTDSSPDKQVKPPSGSSPNNQVKPPSDSNPSDSNPSDSNPSDSNPPTTPPSYGPQDNTDSSPDNTENDDNNSSSSDSLNNLDPQNDINTASSPDTKSSSNVASSNQVAPAQTSSNVYIGGVVFGVIMAVGAAFVGYNTYERIKWRRHFRRGQAAAAQLNPSLANVPDYNGYGRAY